MPWQTVILISKFESASKILSFNSQRHDSSASSFNVKLFNNITSFETHCLQLLSYIKLHCVLLPTYLELFLEWQQRQHSHGHLYLLTPFTSHPNVAVFPQYSLSLLQGLPVVIGI